MGPGAMAPWTSPLNPKCNTTRIRIGAGINLIGQFVNNNVNWYFIISVVIWYANLFQFNRSGETVQPNMSYMPRESSSCADTLGLKTPLL